MIRVALLLAVSACALFAQVKVASINRQLAVTETAEIKKAQGEMEAKFKPRQAEVEKLQKEIASLQGQLQSGQGKLTPQAEQGIQAQGQRRQRELQRLTEDLQGDVERERTEILQRVGGRMQDVVRKLAEERALDVVVDVSNTVYFKPALDITKEATAAYDKAYPLK
ncbi:MAG TPA: OmpH family outer membrane protein [Bryobacteraceae bacterium]|nr:OmpH family outer membrane protein [Bryobacteraceae bacterium]